MKSLVKKAFGGGDRQVKSYGKRLSQINELEAEFLEQPLGKLRGAIVQIRENVKDANDLDARNKILDEELPRVFAIVREAARQVLGMRHFDVQMVGGMVLHEGKVAEMRTGEGKTMVATLPMVLNALSGRGAHLVTVNDYLVQRDAGWMGQVYDALGLSIGVIIADGSFLYDSEYNNEAHDDERFRHLKPCSRKEAYGADITYGTNNEFGFDYLRDNMVSTFEAIRQEDRNFVIVDEVDSILIDEARTPLIISGSAGSSSNAYEEFSKIARQLKPEHYEVDEKRRQAALNDDGVKFVQDKLGVENLYAPENVRLIYHVDQALSAQVLFHRDKQYVVTDEGEVVIVDEFTGRLMDGRRYNEGLHQAIEAKEGVKILEESATLATITFQNFFRMYNKLSGMTGTAETEKEEFYEIYKLDVVVIPTNKPTQRKDLPDRIYPSEKAKFKAIAKEVKEIRERGQAVLIGTASVEKNVVLSNALKSAGIEHSILNAKNHEREAAIVSGAGKKGAVTLATNIAGRGTDIVLDQEVKDAGGLAVIGSERHESRRIDNQLRGRCGRQGDPGQTQFYVSTEDELMRVFGGDRIQSILERLGADEETPIEHKTITKGLEQAQKRVEQMNFEVRKNTVKFDDVINRHRTAVYRQRRALLEGDDVKVQAEELVDEELTSAFNHQADNLKEFAKDFSGTYEFDKSLINKISEMENTEDQLAELQGQIKEAYQAREDEFTPEVMRMMEREIMLKIMDNLWMQHLENMQHLRQGIGLRQIGGRDPLVEYRKEGQALFETMRASQRSEVSRFLFNAKPVHSHDHEAEEVDAEVETELTRAAQSSNLMGSSESVASSPNSQPDDKPSRKEKASKISKPAESIKPVEKKTVRKQQKSAKKKKKAKRKQGRR